METLEERLRNFREILLREFEAGIFRRHQSTFGLMDPDIAALDFARTALLCDDPVLMQTAIDRLREIRETT